MSFKYQLILCLSLSIIFTNCENDEVNQTTTSTSLESDTGFFSEHPNRNFKMGFTSWPYGPNTEDITDTYQYIKNHGDIYTEHIDNKIPWSAYFNNETLPESFTNEIASKLNNRIPNKPLLLSISLLHTDRKDLAQDIDGTTPDYQKINDTKIIDAYTKHVDYLVTQFNPEYLVITIEANDLKMHSETKWQEYLLLIKEVKQTVKQKYPNLKISESITLHNLYQPNISNPEAYVNELIDYMNTMDFVAISYYPFFKQFHTKEKFQIAFDFLHSKINKPIAFVETCHLAEDLVVSRLNLNISSNTVEQNEYLEILLTNAQQQNYEFVIWWTHRDFDQLWNTFPESVKDIGKLWRDTGLLNENGVARPASDTWDKVYTKPFVP